MRKHLYVDNVDLATYGVYISGGGTFSAPEKACTWYGVPNRNGDILGYNRRLLNIEVTYDCFICANFDTNISNLRNFLLSRDGLVRISDDYHTGEFRMGTYEGPFEPTITQKLDAGSFQLTFNCQPQRWLTSGETPITKTKTTSASQSQSYTLNNPTHFHSKPLIRITGDGIVFIANRYIEILTTLTHSYVDIDCDSMACYCGNLNCSPDVIIRYGNEGTSYGADPPTLPPGNWGIYFPAGTNVTEVTITPRYWEV
jgi:phage-related protein